MSPAVALRRLSLFGMLLCLLAGRYLYELPLRGSMILIVGVSMLFLLVLRAEGGQEFDYRPLLGFWAALAATGAAFVVGWEEGVPAHVQAAWIDALAPGSIGKKRPSLRSRSFSCLRVTPA